MFIFYNVSQLLPLVPYQFFFVFTLGFIIFFLINIDYTIALIIFCLLPFEDDSLRRNIIHIEGHILVINYSYTMYLLDRKATINILSVS